MSEKIQVKSLAAILVLALSATAQAETPVVEWTRQLGTTSDDYGRGVSVDGSGNAYVTGYTEGGLDGNTNAGGSDIFLTKISAVPEPDSIAMLAGIALTALLYRKRKHV